ncbi:MAG TPA: response regulator [Xanthobacteraceae bacterium]|nr:response regulator [Xanthobacteraceae bacterium]
MTLPNEALGGRRILILEDESLVSMMIEAMVEELGCEVLGNHGSIERALEFIDQRHADIDIAVLDVNVGGARSYDVAQALAGRGVPFIFSSGYDEGGIDTVWRNHPRLMKPFRLEELEAGLRQALAGAAEPR